MNRPLWQPARSRIETTNLYRFMHMLRDRWGLDLPDYAALHRFSVEDMERFWLSVWEYAGIVAETRGERILMDADKMPGARFFPEARLNFAENLLKRRDDGDAIVFRGESRVHRRLRRNELYRQVSRLAQALEADGVAPGDRVAALMPNLPETVIAMLAAASLGAIFTSCSPDFGVQGVLDRFGQVAPKVLIAADGWFYNGRKHSALAKLRTIAAELPRLERIVVVPYVSEPSGLALPEPRAIRFDDYLAPHPAGEIPFVRLPFDTPLYILYSSGTTGVPKCIVHGAGGTLLKHFEELLLQCDVKPNDRVFYFTTCGWMMWNWLVSALACGATLLLYDGSPFYPSGDVLFDFADAEGMTHFGTSAKYIDALLKAGLEPKRTHRLTALRTLLSTGSPLAPGSFDYVYEKLKSDLCLSSISGGADLIGCFVGGNPMGPVRRGEIQAKVLGMSVEIFDENGRPIEGRKGELVCTRPFPSMPLKFWSDPDERKYRAAYFSRYPGVWRHGDWAEITHHGGIVIYGRSDAVLNPGGVRIGTAEIYRQVERLDEIVESLVVGQDWDDDVRIVLFVRLREGLKLDEALAERIRGQIRDNASPRHVPAKIVQVADIPRTRSGKIVELAVREIIHGRPVKNRDALANPEALELFRNLPELAS
ncbi:acetoacetyl-CoA synthetase [Methylocaldum marinum]|uniref:Acetoacetyl-CoA synthetase n=1 Tax=Methylocaldum marinum TaxID=1432792 RepID=A0A286T7I6_9GAMM|nr:acetoacetate--CoA ligase [Methylocaldum marinum]BBA32015.1 acetoacetyl-CoA synthetase [Methylocaldum marinum]